MVTTRPQNQRTEVGEAPKSWAAGIRGLLSSTAVCPACPLHNCRSHAASMAQILERRVLAANAECVFLTILC